jgi:AraC family transcriptional regulator of adaptative response/methylated-DNA-[protein]-cysteine methyltransferase
MLGAFLGRDRSYDGLFLTAVRTTGIFCRPSCGARKPRPGNVEFYGSTREALLAGYRPCRRCRPMEPAGQTPPWLRELLSEIDADPSRRWTEQDLRDRGLGPGRVRRWFQSNYGMTFHAYSRARRMGLALGRIRQGSDITTAAFDHGYESLSGFRDAFKHVLGLTPGRTAAAETVTVNRVLTPLGPMLAGVTEQGLCLLEFMDRRMLERQLRTLQSRLQATIVPGNHALIDRASEEIAAYFRSELREFTVPLVTPGTEFQKSVWQRLRSIPYGETVSYGALAHDLGHPGGARAVARANGDNRLAIVIPCHRVIGADGRLTGYGGGLWRKRRLLEHEQQGLRDDDGR